MISSHILHEVDRVSDHVVLLSHGYVVAEGQIHDVRTEVTDHPMQILVRCDAPARAGRAACSPPTTWWRSRSTPTARACSCARATPRPSTASSTGSCSRPSVELEAVAPADDDVGAVYQYLIGSDTEAV